ncbi:MAG: hypothetical protein IPL38_16045 [Rhodobacter sp.]|nr:hypothetical protein [Rhodobacter sp.]MBK8440938.1 hypothetical protein [Rhodobacter sp.]
MPKLALAALALSLVLGFGLPVASPEAEPGQLHSLAAPQPVIPHGEQATPVPRPI